MRDSNGHDRGSILSLGILFLVLGGMKVAPPPRRAKSVTDVETSPIQREGEGRHFAPKRVGRTSTGVATFARAVSTTTTLAPRRARFMARASPAGPPPTTAAPYVCPGKRRRRGTGGGEYVGKAPSGSRKPTGPWGRRQASQRHPEASGVGAGGDPTAAASAERTRGAPRSGTPPPPALTRAPVAHKKGEGRTAGSLLGGCQRSFGRPR